MKALDKTPAHDRSDVLIISGANSCWNKPTNTATIWTTMAEEIVATPSKKWAEFLASSPPDMPEQVSDLVHPVSGAQAAVNAPDVFLYCDWEECQGLRNFEREAGSLHVEKNTWGCGYIYYRCRNCRQRRKIYGIAVYWVEGTSGVAKKIGEVPPFGPQTPARVISLIGPDRELFLKGRRAESRGLGIGAFAYYRRVVENQKGRIIEQIAKVAQKLGAKSDVLERFKMAATETQFSKAIDEIKDGIPAVLLIDGHNPLTLLHSALSEALHEHTDEECLEIAAEIRIVLTDLADRLSQALKEEAELKQAVSRLLNRK